MLNHGRLARGAIPLSKLVAFFSILSLVFAVFHLAWAKPAFTGDTDNANEDLLGARYDKKEDFIGEKKSSIGSISIDLSC